MSATTIKAHFKQYTGKGGAATLQFEVLTSAQGFYDAIKLAGQTVVLTIETEQQDSTSTRARSTRWSRFRSMTSLSSAPPTWTPRPAKSTTPLTTRPACWAKGATSHELLRGQRP